MAERIQSKPKRWLEEGTEINRSEWKGIAKTGKSSTGTIKS